MATQTAQPASQVIKDSYVSINVLREDQTPTAEQSAQAIRRLNQMMAVWEANGRHLGYIPIGTVTDVLTVPDAAIMGIWGSLAILLAPLFGASVSPELLEMTQRGLDVIDKITVKEVIAQLDVPEPSDLVGTFSISAG